jgi:hypothetical protein
MHSIALWLLILLPHCSGQAVPAVPPGNGWYYSDHGGFENRCPTDSCKLDCGTGFYRSGCLGNSSGTCVACDNAKPENSAYSTRGDLVSNCAWECKPQFLKQGNSCVSDSLCSNTIPGNSVYSKNNTPNCDHQCRAGFFGAQTDNPAGCSACPAGTYSLQGATVCSDCPAGTYSTMLASPTSMNCVACDAGKYSTAVKASDPSVCTSCTPGTYSATSGASLASQCQGCPAGTASASSGASSLAACTPCGAGKYTDTTGNTACANCAVGTFMNVTGATKCHSCSPNTFAATTGMTACALCEYCTQGNYRTGCGPVSAGFCNACSNMAVG